jgi:NADPH:quinone reductase-like Zn-dependent oxidoreductase
LIKKDDLHQTRVEDAEPPEPKDGEVVLGVDLFGLTTNNITYALLGEAMNYWRFFPAEEDDWAHLPVWGFANVVASKAEGVPEGTRVFGYLPSGSHLVVRPDRASKTDFVDVSPHRAELPGAYQRYLRTDGNEVYAEENEDYEMLLWPLYFTSFLIDDFLDDEGFFGAKLAILSSASSRTTSALAYLLDKREGIEVVGLTSPGNVEFTESLGVYERVVPYEEIESIERQPALYVDVAGDAKVRSAVHGHWRDELKHSAAVGITHKGDLGGSSKLPGPTPTFFFAPTRLKQRTEDWGREELNRRIAEAWRPYVEWVRGWLQVEHGSGPEDIERIYLELLDGKSDPAVGHVLSPD